MLRDLQLRNFRCFESLAVAFARGFNFIVGANGEGKTTLLEAARVLSAFAIAAFVVARAGGARRPELDRRLGARRGTSPAILYAALRRKVAFDGVEQRDPAEYLRLVRVISFANNDLDLIAARLNCGGVISICREAGGRALAPGVARLRTCLALTQCAPQAGSPAPSGAGRLHRAACHDGKFVARAAWRPR